MTYSYVDDGSVSYFVVGVSRKGRGAGGTGRKV